MYGQREQLGINVKNLCYYFDGVERERLDVGKLNRKSGEWLALRSKLLQLPEGTFDVVMKSVNSLVENLVADIPADESSRQKLVERRAAVALFERAAQAEKPVYSSTSAVSETSKVAL